MSESDRFPKKPRTTVSPIGYRGCGPGEKTKISDKGSDADPNYVPKIKKLIEIVNSDALNGIPPGQEDKLPPRK